MKHLKVLLIILILSGCSNNKKNGATSKKLFTLLPNDSTGIDFVNKLTIDESINILAFEYLYNGGGVGIGDINNDGLPDIFLGGNMVKSRLYINQGNFKFKDITNSSGINSEGWISGISMVDINNDGHLDIYLSVIGLDYNGKYPNELYINNGNETFTESAEAYGLNEGSFTIQTAFFDYDNDGDLDAYLSTGGGFEKPCLVPYPIDSSGKSLNTDKLFRNNGSNENGYPTFTNVSKEAGILIEGYGLGISILDINEDGWNDVYVTNDYMSSDLLYVNNKNGSFTEKGADYFKYVSHFAMGNDVADINNDGLLDIMSLDMMPEDHYRRKLMMGAMTQDKLQFSVNQGYKPQFMRNMLQLNNGNGTFSEIGQFAGISKTDWSWATLFADFDNDGYQDIYITNGFGKDITDADFSNFRSNIISSQLDEKAKNKLLQDSINSRPGIKLPNYAYKNKGDLTFKDNSKDWGFETPSFSNGAAYADLDNDGDLDLVVNNVDAPAFIYRNELEKVSLDTTNYLRIKAVGSANNKSGQGGIVKIWCDENIQTRSLYTQRGFLSSVEETIHFGLGKVNLIDSIQLKWPDGKITALKNVTANQTLNINYSEAKDIKSAIPAAETKKLFTEITPDQAIEFLHEENNFNDFDYDFLLPHMFSRGGPGLAVGDVDNNGLDDVIIGGPQLASGTIYFQENYGNFKELPLDLNLKEMNSEDMGLLLFDANNDNNLDLYVVSGGSEYTAAHSRYQDRLYFNDGKGNFSLQKDALPKTESSGSCVVAGDYDKDGDLDLFIGGRVLPGSYPISAQSNILRNDNGKFTKITDEIAPKLSNIGLVSSALWSDFDNDGQLDLVVVGEWMPISFYKNNDGKFTDVTDEMGLNKSNGWWNSIVSGDYDNDGDMDYVVGNYGLNTDYKATEANPLSITYKDFDHNNKLDAVLAYYEEGKNYPAHTKEALVQQMPVLKKKFLMHNDFARATMTDIFSKKALEGSKTKEVYKLTSVYLENLGGAKGFQIFELPVKAQLGQIYGLISRDFDGDGNLDILITGNNSDSENASTGYQEALTGQFLEGQGNGTFEHKKVSESGFFADGPCRALAELQIGDNTSAIIVLRNSKPMQLFKTKSNENSMSINSNEAYALITFNNGKTRKDEFQNGEGYLSQSSRRFYPSKDMVSAKFYSYAESLTREINF